jgi:hypothetical protein
MSYSPTSLPRSADWRDDAECRRPGYDPELWHPAGTTGPWIAVIDHAKRVCAACPVMQECAQWALDQRETGIWGGMTEQDRAAWRRRLQRAAATGTEPAPARTPILVYASHDQAYQANILADNDHLVWVGGNEVKVGGRNWSPNQTAWWATRRAAPVGRVFTDCDRTSCVLHLTDQVVRDARKTAEQAERAARVAAREAARQASKCGTRPGYQLHRQRGEDACQPCKDANAAADRRLRNTGTSKAAKPKAVKAPKPKRQSKPTAPPAPRRTAACGTDSGYRAHRKWGEKACEPCQAAHAEYNRQARARHAKARRAVVQCGTNSGYQTHRNRNEPVCDPCREAHAETSRQYRAAAQAKPPTAGPDCGTRSGLRAHLDRGEAPCQPCVDARARADWLLTPAAACPPWPGAAAPRATTRTTATREAVHAKPVRVRTSSPQQRPSVAFPAARAHGRNVGGRTHRHHPGPVAAVAHDAGGRHRDGAGFRADAPEQAGRGWLVGPEAAGGCRGPVAEGSHQVQDPHSQGCGRARFGRY